MHFQDSYIYDIKGRKDFDIELFLIACSFKFYFHRFSQILVENQYNRYTCICKQLN